MMLPLPKLSAMGLIDYLALGLGVAVGAAIFSAPMASIQEAISKKN
tara:strand:+ start:337 stop:474 length:138 start_codon:yes stop_codon:yes gene_type:complete